MSHTLSGMRGALAGEVTATKTAWPYVAGGIDGSGPGDARPGATALGAIETAAQTASRLKLPALFTERKSASITGPGAGMAALFRNYVVLSTRGWQQIESAHEQIHHGTPAAAGFARANVNLYIDSVYDAHFSIAQLGKQLIAGYKKLGGPAAFGTSLTQGEVDVLATAYSEPSDRLYPHPTVKLGS
ncbi:MAG TPA: hypothetical protein VGN25_05085 [Solirubrobacteraceae bacterium]|nr:hypothetical protein [Solirubrobacteraceae bacterium]